MYCPRCGVESPEGKRYCADCGATLAAPIFTPGMQTQSIQGHQFQIRVNMLCYAGAILGVLALFLPWAVIQSELTDARVNLGPYDFNEGFPSNFRYSVTLFLIGTVLAFLTPVGGILQLIGSIGFMLTASTTTLPLPIDMIFYVGPLIGFLASFMVLASLHSPMGIGYRPGTEYDGISRILSISLYR